MTRPGKPAAAVLAGGLHRHDEHHPFEPKLTAKVEPLDDRPCIVFRDQRGHVHTLDAATTCAHRAASHGVGFAEALDAHPGTTKRLVGAARYLAETYARDHEVTCGCGDRCEAPGIRRYECARCGWPVVGTAHGFRHASNGALGRSPCVRARRRVERTVPRGTFVAGVRDVVRRAS